ncbi:hypothetical protein [Agitococcus lubricus]|uniref:Uncharacterized protein n=1 Tax=Agitococcus lubricus TaxID=1077255 RepID=A0A2T5J3S7_9GAMM|nr:hypothetical protein [Agitococcus lubricus]PTQ91163.1 hypothetical protein C8N29_101235 [Agitococcus lubricus]
MAYMLALLDNTSLTTASQAAIFVAHQRQQAPINSKKFTQFVGLITQIYPDLSEEDEDGDNEENVWEEGLEVASSFGDVKLLVLKEAVTDLPLIQAICHCAQQVGLVVYDEEGQILYK